MTLEFERDGYERHGGAADDCLPALLPLFAQSDRSPGKRLASLGQARAHLAADGAVGRLAADKLGASARPVRAIAFDKSDDANWSLGWHQDRTISVRSRRDVPGFGPWTRKNGVDHVEPPSALLARMVTLRIHLDPVDSGNAPLLVAPGSHRLGRVEEKAVPAALEQCGEAACLADAGDVWLYRTLILHASDRAKRGRRRRVLQLDYAAEDLPSGLEWLEL